MITDQTATLKSGLIFLNIQKNIVISVSTVLYYNNLILEHYNLIKLDISLVLGQQLNKINYGKTLENINNKYEYLLKEYRRERVFNAG